MKRSTWRAVPWVVLLIAVAACAQDKGGGAGSKPGDESRMLKIIDPALLARMVDLARSAKTCTADQLFCTIEMMTLSVGGKDYCVAVAPDVQVATETSADQNNKRRIRWRLSHDSLVGNGVSKDLAFHEDAGIVLTVNQHNQVDRWGKIGDGSVGIVNKRRFHTWTLRNRFGASATYQPVILWGPSGLEELCAAVDPKIANI